MRLGAGVRAAAAAQAGEDALPRLLRRWGWPVAAWQPAAAQLAPLLGWTDAVHLAQALATAESATPAASAGIAKAELPSLHAAAQAALHRLGSELRADFGDGLLERESSEPLTAPLPLADALAPYRLHHAQRQRAMAARADALRQQLREQLAGSGWPRLRQLAGLDAVFERALVGHASRALSQLSARLFDLRAARHHQQDPLGWRRALWHDLQQALQAELALRLLPLQGLVDALDQPSTE